MMVETRPADKPATASTVAGERPWVLGVVMSKQVQGMRRCGTEKRLYVEAPRSSIISKQENGIKTTCRNRFGGDTSGNRFEGCVVKI